MALISRMTRLLRADLHALLDQVEEPGALLRQALREMEDTVAESGRAVDADQHARDALARRRDEIRAGLEPVAGQLDLCLAAGNEALARVLLRRRLEGEQLATRIARQLAQLDERIHASRQSLHEQRQQLDQLRQQAELHAPGDTSPGNTPAPASAGDCAVTDADVELALLRELRSRA
jgi:phage shock protein A